MPRSGGKRAAKRVILLQSGKNLPVDLRLFSVSSINIQGHVANWRLIIIRLVSSNA